jgi:HAMP domain-containing protein
VKIRSKVILFSLLFALSSAVVISWCFITIRREEAAFVNSRRAIKTFAAVTDIEYFFVRQVRLLESYVLLGDESERLQLVQASAQARQRLQEWASAVQQGEAHGEEIPAVQAVSDAIGVPANTVRGLIAHNKRTQAMALMVKEFSPASHQALLKFDGVKRRVQDAKARSENSVILELQRSHLGLMGGLGLVVLFGLVFLSALYRSVIRPIQNMRDWADRVARGEKGLAMTAFSGQNELTELAQSIGEMAIQLTRPKAYPPPLPAEKAPPPPPSREVPSVPATTQTPSVPPVGDEPDSVPGSSMSLQGWAIPQVSDSPPLSPTPPDLTRPQPPVGDPPVKDDFDQAVTEFRDILTRMGRTVPPSPR